MNYILFDDNSWNSLLPLTFTRPVAEIRVGILTIKEKWQKVLGAGTISFLTKEYLQRKYIQNTTDDNILINSSLLPWDNIAEEIKELSINQALLKDNTLIAVRLAKKDVSAFNLAEIGKYAIKEPTAEITRVIEPWQIFSINDKAIKEDFQLLTRQRESASIDPTNTVFNAEQVFIEDGATIRSSVLNAESGPIYIGKNAEVMEGCLIRGPFALGDHSVTKMGAKIYGGTTIGPGCKVGGEINNCVIFGYTNKAHDGFLGNSVLGEWCNIGADSNTSNLKNNYAMVRLWSYEKEKFVPTGLTFCGLIMGDHSKCGINTMFNTGTVCGVNANIYGSGFPRNFIPSFSWGGSSGFTGYKINKALEVAEKVMTRRKLKLLDVEKDILTEVYDLTSQYRQD